MSKGSFWQKFRLRYRISSLNEDTLSEVWHVRLSWMGMFIWAIFLLIITFALFASIIWFTPIKQYLPGYDENIRQELMVQMAKVDSLKQVQELQNSYLAVIQNVMAGEVESDSVISLDSITVVQKEQLLEQSSSVLEDFKIQYEEKEKEKDNFNLLVAHNSVPAIILHTPLNGQIVSTFDPKSENYGISIQPSKEKNIRSVLDGRIVSIEYTIDKQYTILIQHENGYLTLYQNIQVPTKQVSKEVKAGETIGMIADDSPLGFELWQNGKPLNPSEQMIF